MQHVINSSLLDETTGIIVHGVNCRGRMGAGIALAIRKKYPQVFDSYIRYGDALRWRHNFLLGEVDFVRITDRLTIANAFIQEDYGHENKRYASYDAIDRCFATINQYANKLHLPVKYPKIGAGLAGGCWDIISTIIEANQLDTVEHFLYVI